MSLTTINNAKELAASYQPLLLVEITFSDGAVLRLSTHELNSSGGGTPYGGNNYLGRISAQDISQFMSMSETGIDLIPSASLTLADPDAYLYNNYERAKGFKGASLVARLVFYDPITGVFSTDSRLPFSGLCEKPAIDAKHLTVAAVNKTSLMRSLLPVIPIQPRCPWINPVTAAQRATADDVDSAFYECGETRDTGTAPPCDYTLATCTRPLRFGGITYTPPAGMRVREYTSGNWADVKGNGNDAKYGDYFPFLYGCAWIEPPVMNVIPDGNYVRGECVVCVGPADIIRVVVNDVEVSPANKPDGGVWTYANKDFRYNWINDGGRDGAPNEDAPYSGDGDPYGSLTAIMFVVPRAVASGDGIPRVRVLAKRSDLRSGEPSTNVAWVLKDLLTWTNYKASDLDSASFSAVASARVEMPVSLVLRQRQSAQETIRGLRQAFGLMLYTDHSTGKLSVLCKGTLADQQPAPIDGSNYDTAVSSKTAAGVTANGYVAYRFDAASILRRDLPTSLKELARASNDAPNRISFTFNDSERGYATSSISVVDSDDTARMAGQEIAGGLQVQPVGVGRYSDAIRAARVGLAEIHRGNEGGDTRGTRQFEFETTFRALHLKAGQLVLLNDTRLGLSNQLVRIVKLQPSQNYETVKLLVSWHDDDWYTDAYATSGAPAIVTRAHDALARPAFPWSPNQVAPASGDPLYPVSRKTFAVDQEYSAAADGSKLATLALSGVAPVNMISSVPPPRVPLQCTTGSGSISGLRVVWMALASKDSAGKIGAMSGLIRADLGSGSWSITASGLVWDSAASGYALYAGYDPNWMTLQAEASGTPSSVTLSSYLERAAGAPDGEFDHLKARAKRIAVAGVRTVRVSSVTATTITVTGAGWTVNQWAGRDCSVLGHTAGSSIPLANFGIASNTATVLTLSGGAPSPVALGIAAGDYLVIRCKATAASGSGVTDSALSMTAGAMQGKILRVLAGKAAGLTVRLTGNTSTAFEGEFGEVLDSTSRWIVEDPEWSYTAEGSPVENDDPASPLSIALEVGNVTADALLVEVLTVDGGGAEALAAPYREIILTGETGGSVVITSGTQGDNLITGGSFEEADLSAWDVATALTAYASVNTSDSVHGVQSLLVNFGATDPAAIDTPVIPLAAGVPLVFEGWYRRTSLTAATLQIACKFFDAADAEITGALVVPITTGNDAAWVAFSLTGTAPAGTVYALVYAYDGRHTAGTLGVDGLALRRYSPLPASVPVASVAASLFYSADTTTWGMNSSWVWPGDTATIKGIERRAYFYSDEDGAVEIGYADLATLSLDTVTNTAKDGGDWPGYETPTYVRSAVRTANGDLEKGEWVKSDPVLVDAAYGAHSGAYDLTMLASPTITTVGDQFKIEGQFLPGYISPGVSRTVGAAFWWEPGVDGTPSKVGESPYDTTKANQPSPDNQGSYEVWLTKESILTITPDGSGNRTGYLHGLAIEPAAFIPFKPHPTQASTAELALMFTQAQLDGAVPLAAPNPPTAVLAAITSLNGSEYTAGPTWTPPSPAGGTVGYDVEFASMYSVGTPADSDYRARQYVPGVTAAGWKGPAWPKDYRPVYQYVRVRGRGADQQVSAWAYSSNYATIDQNIISTRPVQPQTGDWSVSIVQYSGNLEPGKELKFYAQIRVTYTTQRDGTQWEAYAYTGAAPPSSVNESNWIVGGFGPAVKEHWYEIDSVNPVTIQVAVVNAREGYNPWVDASTLWKSVTTSPTSTVAACTAQSVTPGTPYAIDGVKYFDLTMAWSRPGSDPTYGLTRIYRIACDSSYNPISGQTYESGGYYNGFTSPLVAQKLKSPPAIEYWKYRFTPTDQWGRPNFANSTYVNVSFAAATGIDSTAIGNLGPGLGKDASGKLTSAAAATLMDSNFELGGINWDVTTGAAVVAGAGVDGSKAMRLTANSGYVQAAQTVAAMQNTWYEFVFQAKTTANVAPTAWVAFFKADGSYISSSTTKTLSGSSFAQYKITAQAPATAAKAQVVPGLLSLASTGTCEIDSCEWNALPAPGASQAYDDSGNLVSTRDGINDPQFAFGGGDWRTVDGSGNLIALDSRFAVVAGAGYGGSSAMRLTATGSGATQLHQRQPAEPLSSWRVRGMLRNETNGNVVVQCAFYDSAGAQISTGLSVSQASPSIGTWQTLVNSQSAPTGTVKVGVKAYTLGTSGYCYFSNLSLEPADPLTGALTRSSTDGATKVVDYGITQTLIQDAAVITSKLQDGAVSNQKLGYLAVGTANIGNGVIVAAHIGSAVILDAFIQNLQVTKIYGAGAVNFSGPVDFNTGGINFNIGLLGISCSGNINASGSMSCAFMNALSGTSQFGALALLNALSVSYGGTGSTTPSGARTNLGLTNQTIVINGTSYNVVLIA